MYCNSKEGKHRNAILPAPIGIEPNTTTNHPQRALIQYEKTFLRKYVPKIYLTGGDPVLQHNRSERHQMS